MLGWWIVIKQDKAEGSLASWEVNTDGTDWLDELEAAGKAEKLSGHGYPTSYQAHAADVLPLIADITSRSNIHHGLFPPKIDQDKISACPPDSLLSIEVWDQS